MIAVLKAPSHHLSAKANPSKDNEQLQEDSKQKNEPVYLAARVEKRAPEFAKR